MAGSIPDYKKAKAKADKATAHNLKLYKNWIKLCKDGAGFADDVHSQLLLKESSVETFVKKIDEVQKNWLPAAESLVDLQKELKIAQKKKKSAEVAELKMKIKIAEKSYDKYAKHLNHLFDRMIDRYQASKDLSEAVLKI